MDIGILGTGIVGQTIGTRLVELGHNVMMGSRTANNQNARAWAKAAGHPASFGTYGIRPNLGRSFSIAHQAKARFQLWNLPKQLT
jgi:hypothetical protein